MPTTILLAIALGATIGWSLYIYRRQQAAIRTLVKQKMKILAEEKRVFDFLHGIGEALAEDARPNDIHRLILEGATRIMEAQGGVLYLLDKSGTQLRPAHVSEQCAPLVELAASNQGGTLSTKIKMQAVKIGETVIGETWQQGITVLLEEHDPRLATAKTHGANSAMIAALKYGGRNLGVLALTRSESEPFTLDHLQTFRALAEQSAFSIFDAALHMDAAEKRQFDHDLQVGNEVQKILLPQRSPSLEGYEVEGTNIPAKYLSGDYFDYIMLDENTCGIVIADVSGKGVPAALIMAMARSVLRLLALSGDTPAEILHRLNSLIYPDIKEGMFMSMTYLVLDRRTNVVKFARAGHDAPLICREIEGTVEKAPSKPGLAVGIDSGGAFNRVTSDFTLSLEPGDSLVLYTDGITEALNRQGDEFGLEQMTESIKASAPSGAAGIIQRVTADVRAFIGDYPQHDDITLIAIRKK